MIEIICIILGAALFLSVLDRIISAKREKTEQHPEDEMEGESEEALSPMLLRNGYGVTKDRKPTFAEQWVNIINYCGESQLEGDYEENERNNTGEHLGRVS